MVGTCLFMLEHSKNETILKEEIEDNLFAIYLEDEQINYIPAKDSGYTLDLAKSSCTNGVEVSFDYNTWSVKTNYSNYTYENNERVKCSLYFTSKYIEPLLNGTDPVLEDPLIPVTISDDGTVKKADLSSEWYNYETKKWANAVILFDETKTYASGDIIPEENIESYFVWIPKYRYQLWDLGLYDGLTTIDTSKVHEIPVIFGDYNTSDSVSGECTTPMESGESGNCKVGDYMTHPAFISIPSTGFWVGKFETGYAGATNTTEAEVNEIDSSKIIVKPNVYSWRSIQLANVFYTSYDYKRELDSHMMKNTEWGAVTYLSYSLYGINKSMHENNTLNLVTGYGTLEKFTCGYTGDNSDCNRIENVVPTANGSYSFMYNTEYGVQANTTGNITGIYDMVGGAWEYTMHFMSNEMGQYIVGANSNETSGFSGVLSANLENISGLNIPEEKYFDIYNLSGYLTYYNRILGDATGEIGPFEWYQSGNYGRRISSWDDDQADFMTSDNGYGKFLVRGGVKYGALSIGTLGGVFTFTPGNGESIADRGFRLILTP